MAKASALTETFNANVLNAGVWATYSGTPAASSSVLTLTIASGAANYHGIRSVASFDLTNSFFMTQLVSAGNQALTSLEVYPIWMEVDADNGAFFIINGNNVIAYTRVATTNTNVASVAYSATAHVYFRIMEKDGILYWQTSPDRITWTTLYSATTDSLFAVTSVKAILLAGVYNSELSGTSVTIDNVNVTVSPIARIRTGKQNISPYPFSPRRVR